jgi:hypothetical protein
MNNNYYVLDTVFASNTRFFAGGQVIEGSEEICPDCKSVLPLQPGRKVRITLDHIGRQGFVEYLWNSHSLPIFRSDVIRFWQDVGLSGFLTRPVEIIAWSTANKRNFPERIPDYYCIIPTSHVRLIEPHPQEEEKCDYCGFIKYAFPRVGIYLPNGLHFDLNTLNSNDFFGLIGYKYVFCSERVLEFTLPRKYKHIAFVPISKWCSWEPFDIKKWTPEDYYEYIESFLIR